MNQDTLQQERLEETLNHVVEDLSAAESAVAAYIGDRLGLYRALAEAGPSTSRQLARRTATSERYLREWLHHQAMGGYVVYDPDDETFRLTPEQAAVVADENSPTFLLGLTDVMAALWASADRVVEAFQTGEGIPYSDHDFRLTRGTGRLFGPLYRSSLTEWISTVDGLEQKLREGARVADIGCGTGISTILMAEEFPNSEFVGWDLDEDALDIAREGAVESGVADRINFELAAAGDPPAGDLDVVCFFDSLHDMGEPIAVLESVAERMLPGGIVMAVEPAAADRLEDNFNPVSRLYTAGSILVCIPSALSQGEHALGAQAGPDRLAAVLEAGGLHSAKVATETPFNLVMEARK